MASGWMTSVGSLAEASDTSMTGFAQSIAPGERAEEAEKEAAERFGSEQGVLGEDSEQGQYRNRSKYQ
jgi:hypothetical protein